FRCPRLTRSSHLTPARPVEVCYVNTQHVALFQIGQLTDSLAGIVALETGGGQPLRRPTTIVGTFDPDVDHNAPQRHQLRGARWGASDSSFSACDRPALPTSPPPPSQ